MPITLAEARAAVGQLVVYRASHVPATEPGEEGVITSVSANYVFVRYGLAGSGQATPPERLEFVARPDACRHGQTMFCVQCFTEAGEVPCQPIVGGTPEAPEQEETCGEMDDAGETWCGRNPGHAGDHAARDYDVVTRVWPQR